MSRKIAYMYGEMIYYIITILGGLLLLLYFSLNIIPTSRFVDVTKFTVPNILVGEKISFVSERNVKYSLGGEVIEEINMITNNNTKIMYRNKREVFAEKSNKTVTREIDYIHTQTGQYNLILLLSYDLNFLGIKKRKILEANYLVQ